MFGFLGPERVEFVDMREALITFVTARPKKPGSVCKVRFDLPKAKSKKTDIAVSVISSRPSSTKGHICSGFVHAPEAVLEDLENLLRSFAPRPDLGMAARRSPRLPIALKAMGRELPGFSCVTIDISLHGLRLNCHGPLKQGQVVNLLLEVDVGSVDNFNVRCRVIWSRENREGRGHLVGLEFADLTPQQIDALERYHKTLTIRLQGNIMHRQIADGELVVREKNIEGEATSPSLGKLPPGPPPSPPTR